MLGYITNHGKYEYVPSISGKSIKEARKILEAKGFSVEVSDSIFEPNQPALNVVKQSPDAEALVKHGRTVYLTVNKAVAPTVSMPNLVGLSIKSAVLYLKGVGLQLGDTSFKPDFTRNSVLEMHFKGKEIKQGTPIPVGSKIDLVLSSGPGEELDVPDLVGMTYVNAKQILDSLHLSVGLPIIDGVVTDTAHAYIIRQEPPAFFEPIPNQKVINKIRVGQIVDIWLGVNPPVKDSTQLPDSIRNINIQ